MKLNCQDCDNNLKRERGCTDKGIIPFYIDGERFFRCPHKLVTNTSWELMRAYNFYKNNLLPNGRSWRDETEKFLEAMIVIENEIEVTNKPKRLTRKKRYA